MSELIASVLISLDGFIADPADGVDQLSGSTESAGGREAGQ